MKDTHKVVRGACFPPLNPESSIHVPENQSEESWLYTDLLSLAIEQSPLASDFGELKRDLEPCSGPLGIVDWICFGVWTQLDQARHLIILMAKVTQTKTSSENRDENPREN